MITPYLPFPLHSGGQIRTYNLIKNLSQNHQITLFSFIRSRQEEKYIQKLKPFCHKVSVFKRRRAWDLRNIFLAGLTPYPFLVSIYLSQKVKAAIATELNSGKYDLIHAETFYVMPNLPKTNIPVLLVEQTIEYLVYQRYVEDFKFFFLKPLLYFDVLKIKLWEKYFWGKSASLAAMSEADKAIMQKTVKRQNVGVVANGVDISFFAKTKRSRSANPAVLFVGNFKWLPNLDAANFLVDKIWPTINKKLPQAKLLIVGRNPTKAIIRLGSLPNVTVKGDIDDIRNAFNSAHVLLAPIRNGRGTKYKVLEAMASNIPVVTTKLGIEGIDARDNLSVLVADNPKSLAEKTISVLTDEPLANRLAVNAKKLIIKQYSWLAISKHLDKIYQNLGGA